MDDMHAKDPSHANPRSTAQIGGHPIHPMLVPFPIVCFVGAFLTDVLFAWTSATGWATASVWLLGFGLAFAGLAAVAGFTDFFGDRSIRGHADALKHMAANLTLVALEAVNLALRIGDAGSGRSAGIYLSGVAVVILVYSGWKGGELVFRHGIGVLDRQVR